MLNAGATGTRRITVWLILATLAALVGWLAFRGYFSTDLLLHFSGALTC
jgi:hypothetical protein